jgi:hypothetical protein
MQSRKRRRNLELREGAWRAFNKTKKVDSRRRNFSRSPRTLDMYTRKTNKKKKNKYNGRTG